MKDEKFDFLAHVKKVSDLSLSTLRQLEDEPDNREMQENVLSSFKVIQSVLSRNISSDFSKIISSTRGATPQKLRKFRVETGKYIRASLLKLFGDYVKGARILDNSEAEFLFAFSGRGNS